LKLAALMTVYNEADFIQYAIESCIDHVDNLIIVEGAYQETMKLDKPARSDDGTSEIIHSLFSISEPSGEFHLSRPSGASIDYVQANEKTDKDQRNVGLEIAKKIGADWLLIIDGDEVYSPITFKNISNLCKQFDKAGVLASYFTSLTFVNDFNHYTKQEFPRLFRITPDCEFTNDNFMRWGDLEWQWPHVTKMPKFQYFHYSFCKGLRNDLKKEWWETRFQDEGKNFEYDWYRDENGRWYSPNHKIYKFIGKHPKIVETHPLFVK
jgi:glycosyltransferase involved in cell wall biosynthesis